MILIENLWFQNSYNLCHILIQPGRIYFFVISYNPSISYHTHICLYRYRSILFINTAQYINYHHVLIKKLMLDFFMNSTATYQISSYISIKKLQ